MEPTVSWLLNQSTTDSQYMCIAGKAGLDNLITSINVMDNPDTIPWLKEGELVLSTGYIFTQTNLHIDIIKKLKNRGCSGLGIKMHRYMEEIPDEMIQQANELDFPIISVPYHKTMEEIINMIYHKIFQNEMSESERLTEMYRDIVESSLKSPKIVPLLKKISQFVHCSVFLVLDDYKVTGFHIYREQEQEYPFPFMKNTNYLFPEKDRYQLNKKEKLVNENSKEYIVKYHDKNYAFTLFPLTHEERIIGYLACYNFGKSMANIRYKFLNQIQSILVMVLLKNQMEMRENEMFQNTFYQKILTNSISNIEHIEMLCRQNGFNFSSHFLCMVLHFRKVTEYSLFRKKTFYNGIQESIFRICSSHDLNIHFTVYNNDVVLFLYPLSVDIDYVHKQVEDVANEIINISVKKKADFVIGYSNLHQGADKIYASYSEAIQAFELGQTLHSSQNVFSFEDDMIYHMLQRHSTTTQLFDYYEFALKPLEDFDRENDTFLVDTLKEYIACGLNVTQAAKKMYIHRNTMNHRVEQIKELISMDLRNPDHIYLIQTAFYARKLLQ